MSTVPMPTVAPRMLLTAALACLASFLVLLHPATDALAEDDDISAVGPRTTLFLFGPQLPFMFDIKGQRLDFRWSDLAPYGNTGLGALENGSGMVIGIDREFWVADETDPVPRPLTEETTPSGLVATFIPDNSVDIEASLDLQALQAILDDAFGNTGTYAYMFRLTGIVDALAYQLTSPPPGGAVIEAIAEGDSQAAMTIGTEKFLIENQAVTLIGLRAPAYMNGVLQVPYRIHFIADDKSALGLVTDLLADNLKLEWTRVDAINIHMWDVKAAVE